MLDRPRRLEGGHGHGGTSGLRSTGDGRSLNGRSPNVGTDCDRVHDVGARALSCHVDDTAPRRSGGGRSRLVPSRDVRRRRAHGCRRVHYVRYGRTCSGDGATHRRRRRSHSGRARLCHRPLGHRPLGHRPLGRRPLGHRLLGLGHGSLRRRSLRRHSLRRRSLRHRFLHHRSLGRCRRRRNRDGARSRAVAGRRDHRGGNTGSRGRRVRVAHGRDGG